MLSKNLNYPLDTPIDSINDSRMVTLSIRLTETELATVESAAKRLGWSKTALLKRATLATAKDVQTAKDSELAKSIAKLLTATE